MTCVTDANELQRMLAPEQLREKFRSAGVDLNKPIVTSCGSGVTACIVSLGEAFRRHMNDVIVDRISHCVLFHARFLQPPMCLASRMCPCMTGHGLSGGWRAARTLSGCEIEVCMHNVGV